jgi:hypothetical protein
MDPAMAIVLLIGAAPYPLNDDSARWLEETIRQRCAYDTGYARDLAARACLQLADVLAEDLRWGELSEPIELGSLHAEGLLTYVLQDPPDPTHEELTTLYWGLRRFRGDPV